MADFLNSGGDDIDFDKAASQFPDISLDGEGDFPSMATPAADPVASAPTGFSFDNFGSPPLEQQTSVKVTGDDEIEKFENEFPDIGPTPVPEPVSQLSFSAPRPQPSAFSSTPILNQAMPEEEPDVIKEWRERQQEEIRARDEASQARRTETIDKAEKSIDDFYENYAAMKTRNIQENKETEAEYLQQLQDSLSAGTTWQRICDLVELQNSQSKTIARTGAGTTDLTRFKEVLLRLKREGDAAPGAAGY